VDRVAAAERKYDRARAACAALRRWPSRLGEEAGATRARYSDRARLAYRDAVRPGASLNDDADGERFYTAAIECAARRCRAAALLLARQNETQMLVGGTPWPTPEAAPRSSATIPRGDDARPPSCWPVGRGVPKRGVRCRARVKLVEELTTLKKR